MARYALGPAAGPRPRRDGVFRLDDWTASIRYAVDDRRRLCRVVATLTPDRPARAAPGCQSAGAPLRFAVTLAAGQGHAVALVRPGRGPAAPSVLAIAHAGDALSVEVVRPAAR